MLLSLQNCKPLGIGGLGAIATVCLTVAAVRAAPPTASQPIRPAAAATRPAAASQPASASQPTVDFQAYYETRLAEIQLNDPQALYSLALLCSNRQRPDLAADLARRILVTWPAHNKAKMLLRASTMRLATMSQPAPASRPAMSEPALVVAGVLSQKAINRVRFHELQVDDMTDRPRVQIPKAVLQEFIDHATKAQSMSDLDWTLFRRADNDDKLRWIIKKTDAEQYIDHIQLASEPRSMTLFRRKVWPVISRGCAAPHCHGGDKGGHLRYVLPTAYGPAMTTNFYIASRFEVGEGRLVNREIPEASLLLQFGLPADQTQWRHPIATPSTYTGPNDPKYQIVLDWIRQLRTPSPDYGITDLMWQPYPPRPPATQAGANR
jgi:hypothetical protein